MDLVWIRFWTRKTQRNCQICIFQRVDNTTRSDVRAHGNLAASRTAIWLQAASPDASQTIVSFVTSTSVTNTSVNIVIELHCARQSETAIYARNSPRHRERARARASSLSSYISLSASISLSISLSAPSIFPSPFLISNRFVTTASMYLPHFSSNSPS